jgi:hypothetical protein
VGAQKNPPKFIINFTPAYAIVKMREVDTGATPLAIPVTIQPLVAVYIKETLSPASVNVTEA